MSARAKPQESSGRRAIAMSGGCLRTVQTRDSGSVTSYAVCCCRVSMRPSYSGTRRQKYGPPQANMAIQSRPSYTKRLLQLQDKAVGKRRKKQSRSQGQINAGECRRAGQQRPEAKEGEQASRVVTRTLWCVWVSFRNANRYRCRIASPPCAHQTCWSLAVRFIHLVTHAPGPAGGISKNEGWRVEGVGNQPELGQAAIV
jgi:hypothetical protein